MTITNIEYYEIEVIKEANESLTVRHVEPMLNATNRVIYEINDLKDLKTSKCTTIAVIITPIINNEFSGMRRILNQGM